MERGIKEGEGGREGGRERPAIKWIKEEGEKLTERPGDGRTP